MNVILTIKVYKLINQLHPLHKRTNLHYILYDWCPSGKIIGFLLGTISSARFA